MIVAIFGSNSLISKGLILNLVKYKKYHLFLYTRNKKKLKKWLINNNIKRDIKLDSYNNFLRQKNIDIIISFIGVADPAGIRKLKSKIIDITTKYDNLVIKYLNNNPRTRYIFISSGVVYGKYLNVSSKPPSNYKIKINKNDKNWYLIAKFNRESLHRKLKNLNIIDLRVFNYLSNLQNINYDYFITDLIRKIIFNKIFITSKDNFYRDFIHPHDFNQLIKKIIFSKISNLAIDCYSKSPVDKFTILETMKSKFNLKFKVNQKLKFLSPTADKKYYYSKNKFAKKIDYKPKFSSIDTIIMETKKIINKYKENN